MVRLTASAQRKAATQSRLKPKNNFLVRFDGIKTLKSVVLWPALARHIIHLCHRLIVGISAPPERERQRET